jgi:ABC-type phosphate transport system substrate-binding protein
MNYRRITIITLFVALTWLPAHAHHVAVVVNQQNSAESLSSPELAKIFKSEMRKWPGGQDLVMVLNRNSAVSMQILERLANMPDGKARSFVAAHKDYFLLADSDAEVLKAVAGKPGALGMVDVHAVDSRVKVLKIDGKLPLEKGYLPH